MTGRLTLCNFRKSLRASFKVRFPPPVIVSTADSHTCSVPPPTRLMHPFLEFNAKSDMSNHIFFCSVRLLDPPFSHLTFASYCAPSGGSHRPPYIRPDPGIGRVNSSFDYPQPPFLPRWHPTLKLGGAGFRSTPLPARQWVLFISFFYFPSKSTPPPTSFDRSSTRW